MIQRPALPRCLLPILALASGLLGAVFTHAQPTLVWADEFDTPGLPDPTKWSYDVGGGGWGNNELQYYTDADLDNARVEDGVLIIEARQEASPPNDVFGSRARDYTSGRLVSKSKGDWQYGRFEIRAKLPAGRGTWPAIWMLSTGNEYGVWPNSGEIDIMEHVGFEMNTIYGSLHKGDRFGGNSVTQSLVVDAVDTTFHVYAAEWDPNEIRFYVDDVLYHTAVDPGTGWQGWPFDQPFHLILNIAVGGNLGGQQGIDPDIWPQRMEIDYVRVYDLGDSPVLDADGDSLIDAIDPDDDNDGVSDLVELEYGTNPFLADSDGDGYTDKEEIDAGSLPNDDDVTPATLLPPGSPIALLSNADFSEGVDFWIQRITSFSNAGEIVADIPSSAEVSDFDSIADGVATFSQTGSRSGSVLKVMFQRTGLEVLEPGDKITFRGMASASGNGVTEAVILAGSSDSVAVPLGPEMAEFSLTTVLEIGDILRLRLGFQILVGSGETGSITFSNLSASLEKPSPAEVFDVRLSTPAESTVALSWDTWFLTNYEIWSSPDLSNWTRVMDNIEGNGARLSEVLPVSEGPSFFRVMAGE